MTPKHEVFRAVFGACMLVGDTYDYLPDDGTKYPFFYVGEGDSSPQRSRDMLESVSQTIHIYAERTQRATLEKMLADVRYRLRVLRGPYSYHIQNTGYSERLFPDHTDVVPLLHAVIEVDFNITKKEV